MKAQVKDYKPLMGQGVSLKALGEGNMTTIGFVNYSLLNINKIFFFVVNKMDNVLYNIHPELIMNYMIHK